MGDYWTGTVTDIWLLVLLTLFGGLFIPLLMGLCVWIERREHRIRLAGVSPGEWWIRQRRAAIDRDRIANFASRRLRWSDLVQVWPIAAIAFVVLMPFALWDSLFRDGLLFAIHPIVCVAWWLNMRSRGIIHAEVYALAVWILAYTAWSFAVLAPAEYWQWIEVAPASDFEWPLANALGLTSDQSLGLWLVYAASGVMCVLVGLVLARTDSPRVKPLAAVAVWIPLAAGVWTFNFAFGILGLIISIGVAGYGISREVRRSQDDADMREAAAAPDSRLATRAEWPTGLILRTAVVILVAVAVSIWVRESGMFNQTTIVAVTWSALVLAASATVLLARLDDQPRVASEWAALAWLSTVGVLAAHYLIVYTLPWFARPTWGGDTNQEGTFFLFAYVQALAAGIAAAGLFAVAYRASKLRSYGALLVGLLWLPIALYTAGLHTDVPRDFELLNPGGIAGSTVMGFALLVIMWRVFGPASAEEPSASVQPTEEGLDQSQ